MREITSDLITKFLLPLIRQRTDPPLAEREKVRMRVMNRQLTPLTFFLSPGGGEEKSYLITEHLHLSLKFDVISTNYPA